MTTLGNGTMTLHSEFSGGNAIIVFLPKSTANFIVEKLRRHGYAATAVYTVPDLFVALHTGSYSVAVTTRPDIDVVRNIRSIPVVNLEVFFHRADATSAHIARVEEFDGKAFLNRIGALNVQRPFRDGIDYGDPATAEATLLKEVVPRCWHNFSDLLRRCAWTKK
jgi:hypothetical protein